MQHQAAMSPLASAPETTLDEQSRSFYRAALGQLDKNNLPYLVGGAYAFAREMATLRLQHPQIVTKFASCTV